MENKKLIYIASPYTKGDPCINTWSQLNVFNKLMDDKKVIPYAPLVSHYIHSMCPRSYIDWIEYDLQMLRVFDACLRTDAICDHLNYIESESSGADNEVKYFIENNKPVFYTYEQLYDWIDSQ